MLAAFSVAPMGSPGAEQPESVADAVADCVRIVRESGLPNQTNAMSTLIEGSWEDVMTVIRDCVDATTGAAPRASVVIKLDVRPGHDDMMTGKVRAVEERLRST